MRDYRDAKAMAQTLRDALKQKSVSLTHSESLELIAKILGLHDWNVLSAKIQSDIQSEANPTPIRISTADDRPPVPLPEGTDLPVVPIRDIVLFPHMIAPLFVGREKTRRAIDYAMARDKRIVAVTQRQAGDDDPGQETLYGVGVIASVIDFMPLADSTLRVITKSLERVTLTRCIAGEMLAAKITPLAESRCTSTSTSPRCPIAACRISASRVCSPTQSRRFCRSRSASGRSSSRPATRPPGWRRSSR
jgi:uncharacterized protein